MKELKKLTKKDILYIIIPVIVQSGLYFISKFFISNPHLIGSSIDKNTPFIPQFIYFYVLWYILLVLAPYLLYKYDKDKRDDYSIIYSLTGVLAFIFFLIYPTTINRPVVEIKNLSTLIVYIIYFCDQPILNCLPSIHCTNCFLWIYFLGLNKKVPKKIRLSLNIFCIIVIFSVLFVKQHVLIDVLGAAILVAICFLINYLYKKIIKK